MRIAVALVVALVGFPAPGVIDAEAAMIVAAPKFSSL
jgi:hypothetical protein